MSLATMHYNTVLLLFYCAADYAQCANRSGATNGRSEWPSIMIPQPRTICHLLCCSVQLLLSLAFILTVNINHL